MDTADDEMYVLSNPGYANGLSASFRIMNGPLQPGVYRFTATPALTDRAGNPLHSAFVRHFTVAPLAPFTIEDRDNDSQATATPLGIPLAEDPAGSGLYSGYGRGNLWSTSDYDYYSFSAEAGQLLTVAVEVPGNPAASQLYYRVDRADGTYVTDFYADSYNGWGESDPVVLPVSGTYSVNPGSHVVLREFSGGECGWPGASGKTTTPSDH